MRVTFVLPFAGRNGGTRVALDYAKQLLQRGHEVFVISQPPPRVSWRDGIRSLVRQGRWPARPADASPFLQGSSLPHRILARAGPVLDRDVPDADVVIATWWETAEWVGALSARKGKKVHFVQGDDRLVLPPELDGLRGRIECAWSLPLRKIVVSRWVEKILREGGVMGDIHYVPNSVDVARFTAPEREKRAVPRVGFVYSMPLLKGPDLAVKAFELAKRKRPDLEVVSFGGIVSHPLAPLPSWIQYQVDPSQRMIVESYASCDAWLFPSRNEGFGLPMLEAMACRTPVIATPAGAAPELLAAGGGMLLPPEDAGAMADAILRLCDLPRAEWRALSDAAHTTAHRYTLKQATDLFEAAITGF